MRKKIKFTKEQLKKAADYKLSVAETYVEPRGMEDNPIPKKNK